MVSYSADIVIGSDRGARHNSSTMFWSEGSASRVFNVSDVFYLTQWSTWVANVGLSAVHGGSGYFHGNVGIGTSTPQNKLDVNGTIHAREVKVDLQNWPDYVFTPDYRLRTLSEVKSYIKDNQHLPEVPASSDIEKNGLNLGEMNKLLVKKVEELTLYLINKDEEIKEIKKGIEMLKSNYQKK